MLRALLIVVMSLFLAMPAYGRTVTATWYGARFEGRRMASGLRFRARQRVIAHRHLPLGTRLRVRYKNRTVVGIVLDRGPYCRRASLDLSRSLAHKLGMKRRGVARVHIQVIGRVPKKKWKSYLRRRC